MMELLVGLGPILCCLWRVCGDLGGLGRTVPSEIWRSNVIGGVAKYEQTKNGVKNEIFYEIDFSDCIGAYGLCYIVYG